MDDLMVDQLLSSLSIEEKVGQMTQMNLNVILTGEIHQNPKPYTIDSAKLDEAINKYFVGSFLDCGGEATSKEEWNILISQIKNASLASSAQIPALYAIDAIHGANYTLKSTLFPQPIAQAATWNLELVERLAEITSYEMQASGMHWNFSPVADVGRQPLWSGFAQTFGEDVYLTSSMVGAAVNGYQKQEISKKRVAACAKHFIAQSAPYSGKDRTPIYLAERQIRELYLPPFKEAIASGVRSIMIGSGEINGIPTHTNKYLLKTLLRDELKFDGILITDWGDVGRLITHHKVAADYKEAVKMTIDNGIDVCMAPNDYQFTETLIDLVKTGEISESRIDESVKRILKMKVDLGLFKSEQEPFDFNAFGSSNHKKTSYEVAVESITLLKNENNILPLAEETKIFITGPGANSMAALNGPWSRTWQGTDQLIENESSMTIVDAFNKEWPNIFYNKGSEVDSITDLNESIKLAKQSDVIMVCLTEAHRTEKMGDLDDLELDKAQLEYVEQLSKTNKPIILVMCFNRPRIIREIEKLADAVFMAYLPSNEGGRAISSLLKGEETPSGKLPFTYPRHSNSLLTYDRKNVENEDKHYGQNGFNPQWPFGHGLSYAEFEYSSLELNSDTLLATDSIIISVTLTNKSDLTCKETVMCFLRDEVASITPSVQRLKRFTKVELSPHESHEVKFVLAAEDLMFIGRNNKPNLESGWFEIKIEQLQARFYLDATLKNEEKSELDQRQFQNQQKDLV